MTFDIEREMPPAALVDLDQLAEMVGRPPLATRAYMAQRGAPPAASYRGRLLWLVDDAHKAVAV